nr:MAG TPA: hypothetical protein [Bacteriophage sp.]
MSISLSFAIFLTSSIFVVLFVIRCYNIFNTILKGVLDYPKDHIQL